MRDIPFVDPYLDDREMNAVIEVMKSHYLVEGKHSRDFERKFSEFTGAKHSIICNNGTAALHLALESLDIPPGGEVITTPFTFIATSNSILFGGLVPKFVDVDSETWNLDPHLVESAITEKTKAIMPVHIFGLAADMKHLREIAEKYDLHLIEDAAQGFGARIDGKHVGSFGDVATFSMYATKNLISGEGGVVTTNNDEIADKLDSLKNHGRTIEGGYKHVRVGFNYRLTDMQGAVASVQMDKAEEILSQRKVNAEFYRSVVDDIDGLEYQKVPAGFDHGNYIFALDTRKIGTKPSEAVDSFKANHVLARPIYNKLSYEQENFKAINDWRWAKVIDYPDYTKVKCPVSEEISRNHFEIPVVPSLNNEEREKVAQTIRKVFT